MRDDAGEGQGETEEESCCGSEGEGGPGRRLETRHGWSGRNFRKKKRKALVEKKKVNKEKKVTGQEKISQITLRRDTYHSVKENKGRLEMTGEWTKKLS